MNLLVFRDQAIDIHEQLDLARHFGPLHKHATTPIPKEPGLEEVHGRYLISISLIALDLSGGSRLQ
jgi:alpha-ketoglutarate-dependent taurine dioxygenase